MWYIGKKGTENEIVTNFVGGFTSNEAVLGLTDEFYIYFKDASTYNCRVSIGIWNNKVSKDSGVSKVQSTDLNNEVTFDVTIQELSSNLGDKSIFALLTEKLISKIYEINPDWNNKLFLEL